MIKNYVEMIKDDVDKIIKTGEYDYILENCKTVDELINRLCEALSTDDRVKGNKTRNNSYYEKIVTNFGKEITFAFGEMGLDLIDYLKAERYKDIDFEARLYYLIDALEESIVVVDRWDTLLMETEMNKNVK